MNAQLHLAEENSIDLLNDTIEEFQLNVRESEQIRVERTHFEDARRLLQSLNTNQQQELALLFTTQRARSVCWPAPSNEIGSFGDNIATHESEIREEDLPLHFCEDDDDDDDDDELTFDEEIPAVVSLLHEQHAENPVKLPIEMEVTENIIENYRLDHQSRESKTNTNTNKQPERKMISETLNGAAFRNELRNTIQNLWKKLITKRMQKITNANDMQNSTQATAINKKKDLIPSRLDKKNN
jgi:hypothetical protein